MNQDFFDPEIFADFVLEAKEHLETIEPNLLELEKEPENLALLNDIFRPMHSLKGASGFLGLNTINNLAHKAENILDELRKGNMKVTSEIMDSILAATDALRNMVENLEQEGKEGDVETDHILERFDAIMSGEEGEKSAGEEVVEEEEEPEGGGDEVYSLTLAGEEHLGDFLEEAREIVSDLNETLLKWEKDPQQGGEIVNDLFRYFHNLKGNSGIIGYNELNALTHEAETVLNKVRNDELTPTKEMVDVLLTVADSVESLVEKIDVKAGTVPASDISEMAELLKKTASGTPPKAEPKKKEKKAPQETPAEKEKTPTEDFSGVDPEDLGIFEQTVSQQFDNMQLCLEELAKDGSQNDYADALYRSLSTVQNSAGYMGLDDVKVQSERTAGLVDQGRSSGVGFELMVDILKQEISILEDMVAKKLEAMKSQKPVEQPEPEEDIPSPPKKKSEEVQEEKKSAEGTKKAVPEEKAEEKEPAPEPRKKAQSPATKKAPPPKPDAARENIKTSSTIRVDHEKLDNLMNLIGELIINRNRFSMLSRALEEQHDVQELAQQFTETTYSMARISDELQDTIMKVRMVPVKTVFSRFPRLVRDLSRKSGKKVELILEGEETELDKSLVEVIGDPLVHLIRNSVDHGLEDDEGRKKAGKSVTGKVWLRAFHKGNSVIIEVEDDGRGIDPQKTRKKAVEKGILTQEDAQNIDDQEAVELIFAPGFSTAEKVTDISGRGVGMDVVKNNIKNLKGSVSVQSELGKGSKFSLSLPLTLAIIDALMVKVAGDTYAIPLDAVAETTKIEAEKLTEINNRKAVTLRGEVLGLSDLDSVLGISSENGEREILPVVVISVNDKRLGLVVDTLLERQEIVIKSMGKYLGDLHGISGATIMGDGSVVLILDPSEIYTRATSRTSSFQ